MPMELGLAPAQLPVWWDFVSTMKALVERIRDCRYRVQYEIVSAEPDLPGVLEWYSTEIALRLEAMLKLREGMGALYAALSPRQRLHADRLLPPLIEAFGISDRSMLSSCYVSQKFSVAHEEVKSATK